MDKQTIAKALDEAYKNVSDALGMIYKLHRRGIPANSTERLREVLDTLQEIANEYDQVEVRI